MGADEDFNAAAAMSSNINGHAGRLWSSDFRISELSEMQRAELRQRISIELAHNPAQRARALDRMQMLIDEDRQHAIAAERQRSGR